jgi:hypothetical protein
LVLDLAVRWGHTKLIEYLLTLKWPFDTLKNSLKQAIERKNEAIIKMLKKAMAECKILNKKKFGCFSCFS